jgi:hypothetical protein
MRVEKIVCVALLAAIAFPSLAHAQDDSTVPEQLLGMVGDWRLEQEDPALPACALTFTEDQSIGGWQIILPEPCPAPFPPADSFVAWNVDTETGDVLVTDGLRHEILRLTENEDGLFVTAPGTTPVFYLVFPYDADNMGGEVGDEVGD